MRTMALMVTMLALALPACGKKKPGGGGEGGDLPGPIAAWDMAARKAVWQGNHLLIANGKLAVEVKDGAVTTFDGKDEKTGGTLVLKSPCEAGFKFPDAKTGGTETSYYAYAIGPGNTLIAGMGKAGQKKGDDAVACVGFKTVAVRAGGTCTAWELDFMSKQWKSAPAECSWGKNADGKDVFKVKAEGDDHELMVEGDALLDQQMSTDRSRSFPDYAAAKAAATGG